MKKFVLMLALMAMLLCLCACGSEKTEDTSMIDLTAMSETVMFAEIFNMTMTPDDYVGRTVKMKGEFTAFENPITGQKEYAVLAMDATSCCMQGLDLALADRYADPASYPEEGREVTVTGTYQMTTEDGLTRYRIMDAMWE